MKLPSEYKVLRFFENRIGPATSTETAKALKCDENLAIETNKWLRDEGYLQDSKKPENGTDTKAYCLSPSGKRRLQELRTNFFLSAITAVNATTAIASLVVAILGLVTALS